MEPFIEVIRLAIAGKEPDGTGMRKVAAAGYRLVTEKEEAATIFTAPRAQKCLVMVEVDLSDIEVPNSVFIEECIFSKNVTVRDGAYSDKVTFSNCFFVQKLSFLSIAFRAGLMLEFTSCREFICDYITVQDQFRLQKVALLKKMEIKFSSLDCVFYFQPRHCYITSIAAPDPSSFSPAYNLSHSRFNAPVYFSWSNAADLDFKLILVEARFNETLDLGYDYLSKQGFKHLAYDFDYYIDRVTDSPTEKMFRTEEDYLSYAAGGTPVEPYPQNRAKYNWMATIKASFESLLLYYDHISDSDRVLSLNYFYRKYEAKQASYRDDDQIRYELNLLNYFATLIFLDLPTKFFTSWKRLLVTMALGFLFFSSIYGLFADLLVDGRGKSLYPPLVWSMGSGIDFDRILDACYFSLITFCTIGYGDLNPTHFLKIVAGLEGLFGVLTVSIFTVTLARRILK